MKSNLKHYINADSLVVGKVYSNKNIDVPYFFDYRARPLWHEKNLVNYPDCDPKNFIFLGYESDHNYSEWMILKIFCDGKICYFIASNYSKDFIFYEPR